MYRQRGKQYRIFIIFLSMTILLALNNTATFGQGGTPVPPKLNPADHPDPVIPAAVARPKVSSSSPAINASVPQQSDQMSVVPSSSKGGNTGPLIASPVDARRSNHFLSLIAAYSTVVDPWIMTTDSSGNIFVADTNLQVVKKLSPTGTLIQTYGTSGVTGTGPGLFSGPSGIALVGTDVFIGDYFNGRIQRFNISTGAFVSQFGMAGSGTNQLNFPAQMAYDPFNGFLYVAELGNARVHIFNTSGVSQGTFGMSGTGTGQFTQPFGLVIDPLGYLYVGEFGGNRVQKFTSNGTYIRSIGSSGGGNGQFANPQGLAMDRAGFLYVADRSNVRVQKFDWKGGYVGQYGTNGPTCTVSFINCRGFFNTPVGVTVSNVANAQPILYVADFGNNTLQAFETSLQPLSHPFEAKWGTLGTGAGQFSSPKGTAVDSAGNVYVTDASNNRVQKFDKYGTFIRQWGSTGNGVGEFSNPFGIAVNSANNVFVVDANNDRIQVFDTNGAFIRQWGSTGTGNGFFSSPRFVAVDSNYVYVTEYGNDRVQKFNFVGSFILKWGTPGNALGQLSGPEGIAIDTNRQFAYVSEFGNNRVQIFTVFGDPVSIVTASTTGPGALIEAYGLTIDQHGSVYVSDRFAGRIVQFSDNGQYIGAFGSTGSGDGQLTSAYSLTIDRSTGQMFVADTSNNRIQRFGSTVPKNDTVGVWRPSTRSFYMRNSNTTGVADISVDTSAFTVTTDQPIVGDWNG
ncbi:MAG: 6-bladed beta-propeller, partial [Chloroflexota bacterium]